ncbi:MAG TPA: hypothetical protein VJT31_17495 [Rugosimonospora sp.]|nr:hypothetical protein [Rugosimonospora sp.]
MAMLVAERPRSASIDGSHDGRGVLSEEEIYKRWPASAPYTIAVREPLLQAYGRNSGPFVKFVEAVKLRYPKFAGEETRKLAKRLAGQFAAPGGPPWRTVQWILELTVAPEVRDDARHRFADLYRQTRGQPPPGEKDTDAAELVDLSTVADPPPELRSHQTAAAAGRWQQDAQRYQREAKRWQRKAEDLAQIVRAAGLAAVEDQPLDVRQSDADVDMFADRSLRPTDAAGSSRHEPSTSHPQLQPSAAPDIDRILATVRAVAGVRDAQLHPKPAGARSAPPAPSVTASYTLRFQMLPGADTAEVTRRVGDALQQLGLAYKAVSGATPTNHTSAANSSGPCSSHHCRGHIYGPFLGVVNNARAGSGTGQVADETDLAAATWDPEPSPFPGLPGRLSLAPGCHRADLLDDLDIEEEFGEIARRLQDEGLGEDEPSRSVGHCPAPGTEPDYIRPHGPWRCRPSVQCHRRPRQWPLVALVCLLGSAAVATACHLRMAWRVLRSRRPASPLPNGDRSQRRRLLDEARHGYGHIPLKRGDDTWSDADYPWDPWRRDPHDIPDRAHANDSPEHLGRAAAPPPTSGRANPSSNQNIAADQTERAQIDALALIDANRDLLIDAQTDAYRHAASARGRLTRALRGGDAAQIAAARRRLTQAEAAADRVSRAANAEWQRLTAERENIMEPFYYRRWGTRPPWTDNASSERPG